MTQNYLSWEAIKLKFSSQRNYDKKKLKEKKITTWWSDIFLSFYVGVYVWKT